MSKRHVSLILAVSSLALTAAGALSITPGRINGFGPEVINDPTLNANLGVLRQEIAWQNSPAGDVFQVAQATEVETFDNVAELSSASMALGVWSNVRNDATLDRSNHILSQVIAWLNSPAGDAYQLAEAPAMVRGSDFDRVALASIPRGSQEF